MDDGHVAIDAIESIRRRDITAALAKESGFSSVDELLKIAQHGAGSNIYLIRFHYLPAGAWDAPVRPNGPGDDRAPLLERIQRTPASRARRARKRGRAL
jgi:hypothetical protein